MDKHKTTFLPPGSIQRMHHSGILYFTHVMRREKEPKCFQIIRQFWSNLGMQCVARFAETSPDSAWKGWRLYVGNIVHPEQISYRPIPEDSILWRLFVAEVRTDIEERMVSAVMNHACMEVGPEAFKTLQQHPMFNGIARWSASHGRVSVRLRGPIGEDLEFTCPYVEQ